MDEIEWGFAGLDIVNVDCDSLVCPFLGLLYLGICKGEEPLYDNLNGGDICVLCNVFVLHEH